MIKAIFRSPITTAVLFIVAAALLLGGTVGAVSAAPRIQSDDYQAQVKLTNIKTALLEEQGGKYVEVAGDDKIAQKRFYEEAGDTELKLGKAYGEKLAVRNVGTIPQYVRLTVKKYWVDSEGKRVDLSPDYIDLNFVNSGKWKEDTSARTDEQRVFYYSDILDPGQDSVELTDKLTINGAVASAMSKGKYQYDGVEFRIQARVDAVQTHNGEDAMTSAWGRTN